MNLFDTACGMPLYAVDWVALEDLDLENCQKKPQNLRRLPCLPCLIARYRPLKSEISWRVRQRSVGPSRTRRILWNIEVTSDHVSFSFCMFAGCPVVPFVQGLQKEESRSQLCGGNAMLCLWVVGMLLYVAVGVPEHSWGWWDPRLRPPKLRRRKFEVDGGPAFHCTLRLSLNILSTPLYLNIDRCWQRKCTQSVLPQLFPCKI